MPDGAISPIPGLVGRGDWIQTFSGGIFYPLAPRVEDVRLKDIAHHLSLKTRYCGAVRFHYSVAQHAYLLSHAVPPELAYAALHHDDSEAYLPDVPSPVKPFLPGWKAIEALNTQVIAVEGFGVDPADLEAIKPWDARIRADETRDALNPCERRWEREYEPLGVRIAPLPPCWAEDAFLARHAELVLAGHGASRAVR